MKKKNLICDKSFDFALRIVKLYKYLCDKKEFVMSKQLLRSGTSIGANVKEAVQGQSKRDFLSKMNIALKEASEVEYWIELLLKSEYLTKKQGGLFCRIVFRLRRYYIRLLKARKKQLRIEDGELRI